MKNSNKEISVEVKEIVFSSEEEKSFCDVFVYEPENIGEQALGNLYIVGEITNVSENSSYLVNLLASIIKKEFYSNTKRTIIESLEASLHKANATLSDIAEQGNIDWIGNLNMICAVHSKNELHLSQTGNCKTLLIRSGQITDIGKKIIKEEKTHPFRTFANIASGELEIGDIALFATPEFFNVFSLEKLKKLSLSLDFNEFVEKLQDSIEQEKDIDTAGSLIMKIKKEKQKEDNLSHTEIEPVIEEVYEEETTSVLREEIKKDADEKIKKWAEKGSDNVFEKEKIDVSADTSEFSETVSGQISQKKEKISLENIIKEYEEKEDEDGEEKKETKIFKKIEKETDNGKTEIIKEEQYEENGVSLDDLIEKSDYFEEKSKSGILEKLLKTLNGILSFIKIKIVAPVTNRAGKMTGETDNDILEKVSVGTETEPSQRVKLIPVKNKHLLVIFAIIAVVLVWNIISTNYQKGENDKFEEYSNVLSQAESKINEVESIVIYGDFEMARELLTSAKISALEVKNEYNKLDNEADVLLKKIQVQFDRVDLVNRIDSPKIAVDLSQTDKLKNAGGITKIGKEYYISDLSNNSLHQADFENNKVDIIQTKIGDDIGKFRISTAMEKTGEIIFLTDSNKIVAFNVKKKELSARDIEFSNSISDAKDIASYSSYLYLLKPDSNQIYKHTRLASGFGEGKIWIEDPEADIRNAVSLAIDGSIYVLKSDGSVEKYLSGSKFKLDDDSDFSIEKLGDPISNPTEIYTRSDLEYLYIIEPQKNRVIIFDKNSGKLIKQYISGSFSDLKNITVDDKEEKMYVLSGDKVFEVGIGE